jgi:Arc/MetJ-type ribon-helix-helix transcriptional regulator
LLSGTKLDSVSFMPTPKSKSAAPLTFDLPVSLIAKIARAKRGHALGSASDVVRLALEQFDLGSFQPVRDPHRQISVRIASKQRAALCGAAKRKHASVGELIRAALEQLSVKPARAGKTGRR